MVNNEFSFGFRRENCAENKIRTTSGSKYAIRNTVYVSENNIINVVEKLQNRFLKYILQ